jgi:protein-tyrosine phosphatase
MKKLLVVCMGNICRSPMALVVLRSAVARAGQEGQIRIDSAGTHASHLSEKPDPRAEAALLRRGYEIGRIRSRKVNARDFSSFDWILAMDANNLADLKRICPPEESHKLQLFMGFGAPLVTPPVHLDVPDPYYGNAAGFEKVLDMCERGSAQVLAKLAQ